MIPWRVDVAAALAAGADYLLVELASAYGEFRVAVLEDGRAAARVPLLVPVGIVAILRLGEERDTLVADICGSPTGTRTQASETIWENV